MAMEQNPEMSRGEGQREGAPVSFVCYRIDMGEESASEGMNTYSVTILMPDGELRHQVYRANDPEDVGQSLMVPPGTRVIMTEMASLQIWDSEPARRDIASEAETTA